MKQYFFKCVACCLLGVALTFSIASAMDECKTASPALMGESKKIERSSVAGVLRPTHKQLYDSLYNLIDQMPPELIRIVLAYCPYEFKEQRIKTIKSYNDQLITYVCFMSPKVIAIMLAPYLKNDKNEYEVELINFEKNKRLGVINTGSPIQRLFKLAPHILVTEHYAEIKIWDAKTKALIRVIDVPHLCLVQRLSKTLLALWDDGIQPGRTRIFDSTTSSFVWENPTFVSALVKLPHTETLAVISSGKALCFWNYKTNEKPIQSSVSPKDLSDASHLKVVSDNTLAIINRFGGFTLFDFNSGRLTRKFPINASPRVLKFSQGLLFVRDGSVGFFDKTTEQFEQKEVKSFECKQADVRSDGLLVATDESNMVTFWR